MIARRAFLAIAAALVGRPHVAQTLQPAPAQPQVVIPPGITPIAYCAFDGGRLINYGMLTTGTLDGADSSHVRVDRNLTVAVCETCGLVSAYVIPPGTRPGGKA